MKDGLRMHGWRLGISGRLLALSAFLLGAAALFFMPAQSSALTTVPTKMNFQGRLTDSSGNIMPNGTYNMRLKLYSVSSGGTAVWSEDRLVSASQGITVTNGLFSIKLGDVTSLPASHFASGELYLEVELPSPATATSASPSWTEGPMTPRNQMATSAYAYNSETLDGLDSAAFGQLSQNNTWSGNNTFSGSVLAQGSLTLGTTAAQGSLVVHDGNGQTATIRVADTAGSYVYTLPVTTANDTFCLQTLANCGGAGGGGLATTVKRKATTESVTSSTTMQNDDELFFSVGANETWTFEFDVHVYAPNTGGGMKLTVTAPSGSTCKVGVEYLSTNSLSEAANSSVACGTAVALTKLESRDQVVKVTGSIANGSTAGVITLQWAQNGSSASASQVLVGSSLKAVTAGEGGGISTIGALDGGTANANGASVSGASLFLQSASASYAGLVSTTTQTFAGNKTFSGTLTVSSAATFNGTLTVGTADTTGTLLVLDTKTDAGDPVGTNGAIYYNSSLGKFRCYQNGAWTDCIGSGGSAGVQRVTLLPEYIGGVLTADGSNNNVNVTAKSAAGLSAAQGYKHNFYEWDTTASTAQDYDIVINYQLPSNFTSFVTGSFRLWTYADSLTGTDITFMVKSSTDALCYASAVSIKPTVGATWENRAPGDPANGCTFAANDTITFVIKPTVIQPSTNKLKIGELRFEYQ